MTAPIKNAFVKALQTQNIKKDFEDIVKETHQMNVFHVFLKHF